MQIATECTLEGETLVLDQDVYSVRLSDGIVYLDVRRDAYFCMYDAALDVAPCHSEVTERGWRDLPEWTRPRLGIRDIGRFVAALMRSTFLFRRLTFAGLINHVRRRQPSVRGSDVDPLLIQRAVSHFERLCLWLPLKDKCLFRAFFLLHFLGRYGLGGDWIFGVSLFPFEAHCWIADGDLLLGERAHRLEGYSTILSVDQPRA